MNVGIVGCGYIGKKHIQAIKKAGDNVVGIADPVLQSRYFQDDGVAWIAELNSYPAMFASFEEMLSDGRFDKLDAVVIGTPNNALMFNLKVAIDNNIHALVEKPCGTDAETIRRLDAESREVGVFVQAAYNHRFHPALIGARNMLMNGTIGKFMFMKVSYGHGARLGYEKEWRMNKEIAGGGELMDQGVHVIDLVQWMTPHLEWGVSTATLANLFWMAEVEDNVFFTMTDRRDAMCQIHVSCTEWRNTFSMEIYGKTGKIHVQGLGGSYGTETLTLYHMSPKMGIPDITTWTYAKEDNSFYDQWIDFKEHLSQGLEPSCSLTDAYKTLRVVEDIYDYCS